MDALPTSMDIYYLLYVSYIFHVQPAQVDYRSGVHSWISTYPTCKTDHSKSEQPTSFDEYSGVRISNFHCILFGKFENNWNVETLGFIILQKFLFF